MYDSKNFLLFVKWKDNNIFTMGNNFYSIDPQSTVKRWSSIEEEKTYVPQALLFNHCNSSMRGVDLLDQSLPYKHSIKEVVLDARN